ncbi:MAG: hypothetical protein ACRC92_26875 [Peptostreptococcaceae bacterium]
MLQNNFKPVVKDYEVMCGDFKSLEELFEEDLKSKNGFILNLDADYTKLTDLELVRGNSIYSYKFKMDHNTPKEILAKKYTCGCEETIGVNNEGTVCLTCGSMVEKRKFPVGIRGWIDLGDVKVLTPFAIGWLSETLNDTIFKSNISKDYDPKAFTKNPTKFGEYLMSELYDNWEDFLDKYRGPSESKRTRAEFLKKMKEKCFTTKIPVISSRLRFLTITMNMDVPKVTSHDLNTLYAPLIQNVKSLIQLRHDNNTTILNIKLKDITTILYSVFENLYSDLGGGKNKLIKSNIVSMRIPYTTRCVLVPYTGPSPRLDICVIHYDAFRGMFSPEIEEYMESRDMPKRMIDKMVDLDRSLTDDEKKILRYDIFPNIQDKYIIENREPAIDYPSLMTFEVIDLSDRKVIAVPNVTISAQRADFDGDEYMGFKPVAAIRRNVYHQMNPKRYIVTPDRKYSGKIDLINDQNISFMMSLEGDDYDHDAWSDDELGACA